MYSTLPTPRKLSRLSRVLAPKQNILWYSRAIRKRPFVWLLVFFLLGFLAAQILPSPATALTAFVAALCCYGVAQILKKSKHASCRNFVGMALALLLLCLGATANLLSRDRLDRDAKWIAEQRPSEYYLCSEPIIKSQRLRMQLRAKGARAKLMLFVAQKDLGKDFQLDDLNVGSAIRVSGLKFNSSAKIWARTPGYAKYLEAKGLCGSAFAKSIKIEGESLAVPWAIALRQRLLEGLDLLHLSPDQKQMLAAMTLGKRDETESLRQLFASTGTSHILSVSGFHVGIILASSLAFFSLFLRGKRYEIMRWILVLAIGWIFACLCALNPPVQRAMLMASLYVIAKLLRRQADPCNIIAAAAFILLIVRPLSIFDIGFQLSFVAVFSILLFYPLFRVLIPGVQQPIMKWLWQSLCIGLAAQVLSIPLVLYHFTQSSSTFIWGNLPMLLIATVLIPLSLLTLILALSGWVWAPLASTVEMLSQLGLDILEHVAAIPLSAISWQPNINALIAVYSCILLVWTILWQTKAIRKLL